MEERREPRSPASQYSSVEFSASKVSPVHQFKLRDISASGMGILVKEDSAVLTDLKVGDTLDMKYYPLDLSEPEHMNTEIRHITKAEEERFKGHYFVGLLILAKQNADT